MTREETMDKIRGCMIPIPTLFDDHLELNLSEMQRHIRWLIECGAQEGNGYILAGAATGEFANMDAGERKALAAAVIEAADGKIPVVVGAQETNWRETREIALFAKEQGATAVQISPPYYYPPTDDDIYEYYQMASQELGIGIIVYHTWWMGYTMSFDVLDRLVELENIVSLKWSASDYLTWQRGYQRYSQKVAMANNHLDHVGAVMFGATSINIHPSNFWPEWGIKLWGLLENRKWEEAQKMQTTLLFPLYDIYGEATAEYGGEGHLDKVALDLIGFRGGICRPPIRPLPPIYQEKLSKLFDQAGVPCPRV